MKPSKPLAVILSLLLLCLPACAAADSGEAPQSLTLKNAGTLSLPADCSALQTVTLINCPAMDLSPLAACPRLTSVTIVWQDGCCGTAPYDLSPLAQCARLTSLTLQGPCVEDLTPLEAMTALATLCVSSLAVKDYTPVTSLQLKHLSLSGVPGGQVGEIFTAIGRRLESAVIGSCTLTQEACGAILQAAKLTSLRFEQVEGIDTAADAWTTLTNLSSLQMTGCALNSLAFLSSFVATVIIKLDDVAVDGSVCSIAFDKYFLDCDNVPADAMLDFLSGSGRQWLYATVGMEAGTVSKAVIAAFADIGSLLSLDVERAAADAWSADVWQGFPRLEQLKLSDSGTVDLGFIPQLTALERLVISNTAVTGSDAVGNLPLLTQLTLLACELDSWDFLCGLTSLTLLTAAGCNGPTTLDFAPALKHLTSLALENAPITDLSPLTGHKLQSLYLYGCPIADYAPLTTLPNLALLSCSEDAALPQLSCRVVHARYFAFSD